MLRKIRQLRTDLRQAGFSVVPGGKGSHQEWVHPSGVTAIVPGADGDDAKPYLERHVVAHEHAEHRQVNGAGSH